MNGRRRIQASIIVPRMRRPQQTQQRGVPAVTTTTTRSRDPSHDVNETTTGQRRYSGISMQRSQTNRLQVADRGGTAVQPEAVDGQRTSGFVGGCRRQPVLQAKWALKMRTDVPVDSGRRGLTQPIVVGKELPVDGVPGRPRRQRTYCDQRQQQQQHQHLVNRTNTQTVTKPSHSLRHAIKPGPEVEISMRRNGGERSAAVSQNVLAAAENGSTTSRDSVETSVTWYNGDDVTPQVRGRSAETSGVFSRMSTEARQAWIAVKQSETTGSTSDNEPSSRARADQRTFGVDNFISGSAARNSHQRRGKRTTQETAYDVFEPPYNEAKEAPVNSAATYRVLTATRRGRHDSRAAFGSFRITSAAYDSRFVDMAAAAAASASHGVPNDGADEYYDDDDDDEDAEIRAASVAKCLSWLRTQRYSYNVH